MKRCIALSVVVLMTGCRTVDWVSQRDQELPADTLKRIALQIERAVQRGDRDPVIADRDGIVVNSDEVRQAIRARAARSELLNEIRDTGHAWERRDGLLYLRRTKEFKAFGTPGLRQRYASVVFHENDSRWTLYESILRDGDFPRRSLDAIRLTFYEARLECMPKGQKCEDVAGDVAYVGGEPKESDM